MCLSVNNCLNSKVDTKCQHAHQAANDACRSDHDESVTTVASSLVAGINSHIADASAYQTMNHKA